MVSKKSRWWRGMVSKKSRWWMEMRVGGRRPVGRHRKWGEGVREDMNVLEIEEDMA